MGILKDLSGAWLCRIPGMEKEARLPGTLDENGIGFPEKGAAKWHPDEHVNEHLAGSGVIATRLTRRVTWEGAAEWRRHLSLSPEALSGGRLFAEAERSRVLRLWINGREVPPARPGTLVSPWVFEVTGRLTGEDEWTFVSDNSYPGWPHDDIVYSSAATDETQTNWNGILGFFRLRRERDAFIESVRVLPGRDSVTVYVTLNAREPWQGSLRVTGDCLEAPAQSGRETVRGRRELCLGALPVRKDAARWDLEEGALQTLSISGPGLEERCVRFGLRVFESAGGHFCLNGRRIFLRAEANCAVFPETGHPPMDRESWRGILSTYRAYGVNCMRFHSHTPPEAAFEAADEMGMLMQPECCHWNPRTAFESGESAAYYRQETGALLETLACHPSFVMLSFGNELHAGPLGHERMRALLRSCRAFDPTRLYADASNPHYGRLPPEQENGFYTAAHAGGEDLRATSAGMHGTLNHTHPSETVTWDKAVKSLRESYPGPIVSFEVGQYEVLPDLKEIDAFHGVTRPDNFCLIRDKAEKAGLLPEWEDRVAATGELALRCYRAEVEAALRTEELAGISLLGLQDFPGQGTALVGMLNSHLVPKPYPFAAPERFRAFFRDRLPLVLLPAYTYSSGDRLRAPVRLRNCGREALEGEVTWALGPLRGTLGRAVCPPGEMCDPGMLDIPLPRTERAVRETLTVSAAGEENTYPIWIYPDLPAVLPEGILRADRLDERACAVLRAGGRVYLSLKEADLAPGRSIRAQFSTDFWSVGTFPRQEGGMGQWIDRDHPLFREFPTDAHTDWQWAPMAGQRALILPGPMKTIVAEMDSYAAMRPMAQLLEARCLGGRLMLSSLALETLSAYPEARALERALYAYMDSGAFLPAQEVDPSWVRSLTEG